MATTAQILANRENAAASTGPRTESGKAAVSQNALKTGLFSKGCLIDPQHREDFETLREKLWESFAPQTAAEELIVNEIIRAGWRLQRCAFTEEMLWDIRDDGGSFMMNQIAVDRARVQATGILNRNIEQLRKLQTNRWTLHETVPEDFDKSQAGIASPKEVIAALTARRGQFFQSRETKQTQSGADFRSARSGTQVPAQSPEQNKPNFHPAFYDNPI